MLKCILHDAGCEEENLPGSVQCLLDIADLQSPPPVTKIAPKWLLDMHREEVITASLLGAAAAAVLLCLAITLIV